MQEYTTVFTIKVDVHSMAKNSHDGALMNEITIKDYLAQMFGRAEIDGVNIIKVGETYETKKEL